MLLHLGLDLLKWIGVLVFVSGLAGSFLLRDPTQQRQAAQWLAAPGLVLVWLGGYGLLTLSGISMMSTWVTGAMLLTLAMLHLALAAVRQPAMRGFYGLFAGLLLLANLLLMIEKPGTVHEQHPTPEAPDEP
ncbi:MAG: hypothetical protein EA397_20375 [Deltaproteobacteria bacterium]|nr:MAG: hypothetical protein EA397_20375 [Deltaproteobacteria bacterium]